MNDISTVDKIWEVRGEKIGTESTNNGGSRMAWNGPSLGIELVTWREMFMDPSHNDAQRGGENRVGTSPAPPAHRNIDI